MQSSPNKQGFKLPANPNVTDTVCFQLNIPNDPAYISAFLGVIYDMSVWTSWQRDSAHTGIIAAQRMKQVYNQVSSGLAGCELTSLRLKPGNNCIVQVSNDGGTTWTDEIDLSLCSAETATGIIDQMFPPTNPADRGQPGVQPGGGSPTPGQCFDIDITVKSTTQTLIPLAIDSGWTITISNPTGLWNDGVFAPAHWFCNDGHQYALGVCTPYTISDPTDPLTSVPHMTLLIKLPDNSYAQLLPGVPYVVPSGQPTGDYYLMPNDGNLPDNGGEIKIHLQACNTADFSHTFDFSLNNGGWVDGGNGSTWTPGYWQGGTAAHSGDDCEIIRYIGATRVLKSITVYTTQTNAGGANNVNDINGRIGGGFTYLRSDVAQGSGTHINTWTGLQSMDAIEVDYNAGANPGSLTHVTKVIVTGVGSDPF